MEPKQLLNERSGDRTELLTKCDELANKPSILDELEREIRKRGFSGSADIPKLVFLVLCTGFLGRPVSLVIKGPSGSGKSFGLNAGKQFIPSAAFEQFEGMSEKALVYLPNLDLRHKHLIVSEAAGLADGYGRTLVRQLVSEGKVRYATVQSTSKGLDGVELPTLEGPTGLIMTTTAPEIHPEDESRMLSVTLNQSPEQIAEALMTQALGTGKKVDPLETGPWFALYDYVRSGPVQVEIPFAGEIAKRLPTTHDRVKRDFPQVLSLLTAHALLHSCSRERNGDGAVVATANDYAAVYRLINEPLSQGLEVTVPHSIRETVEAVSAIWKEGLRGNLSLAMLEERLKRDRSVISRNVAKAIEQGYLRNDNPGQGKEASLHTGDRKLPAGSVLPSPEELFPVEGNDMERAERVPLPKGWAKRYVK